jgi:hypothetical protein
MEWLKQQLERIFFDIAISRCDEGSKITTNQFKTTVKAKKNGAYRDLVGVITVDFGNYEGYLLKWTSDVRNELANCIAIGEENIDEETGIFTIAFNVIINNEVK